MNYQCLMYTIYDVDAKTVNKFKIILAKFCIKHDIKYNWRTELIRIVS